MKKLPSLIACLFLFVGSTFTQPPKWMDQDDYHYQNFDNRSFIKYGDLDEYRSVQDEFWVSLPDVFVKEAKKVKRKMKKQKKRFGFKSQTEIQITSNRKELILSVAIDDFESKTINYELVTRKNKVIKSGAVSDDFELSVWRCQPEKYWLNFYDSENGTLLKTYKVFRF